MFAGGFSMDGWLSNSSSCIKACRSFLASSKSQCVFHEETLVSKGRWKCPFPSVVILLRKKNSIMVYNHMLYITLRGKIASIYMKIFVSVKSRMSHDIPSMVLYSEGTWWQFLKVEPEIILSWRAFLLAIKCWPKA